MIANLILKDSIRMSRHRHAVLERLIIPTKIKGYRIIFIGVATKQLLFL